MTKETTSSEKLKISFDIPQKMLLDMDTERKKTGQSRSNWISIAIMEKLAKAKRIEKDDEDIKE